jgi:hypothetical protein
MTSLPSAFPIDLQRLRATLRTLLHDAEQPEASMVVATGEISARVSGTDNWDGGTQLWALAVEVDAEIFAAYNAEQRGIFESSIVEQTNLLLRRFGNHQCAQAHIVPALVPAEPAAVPTPVDRARGFLRREYFLEARELVLADEALIGSGGSGEVLRARHRHTGLPLALKFFRPRLMPVESEDSLRKARERLVREAKLLGTVRHSNVLKLLDFSIVAGDPVLVLEYIDGSSVSRLQKTGKTWTEREVVNILLQVLSALAECHRLGVVHRDVAPGNVVVEPGGRAVLVDFGLGFSAELAAVPRMTTQAMGTPGFMAPEMTAEPLSTSPLIDLFGAAALGAYMLKGRVPNVAAPDLTTDTPGLAAALRRGLEVDPARRFQSAEDFAGALRELGSPVGNHVVAAGLIEPFEEWVWYSFLGIEKVDGGGDAWDRDYASHFASVAIQLARSDAGALPGLVTLLCKARQYRAGEDSCEISTVLGVLADFDATVNGATEARPPAELGRAVEMAIEKAWIARKEVGERRSRRTLVVVTGTGERWLSRNTYFSPPPADW